MTGRLLSAALLLAMLAPPAPAAAYQERLVHSIQLGRCALKLEADDEARGLRVRVSPEGVKPPCTASREELQRLLREAFSRTAPPRLEGVYRSLYLGRLVEFPWLSAELVASAAADAAWDARKGRPVGKDPNAYVAAILSRRAVTEPLQSAIAGSGHRIRAASVEKVLVGDRRLRGGEGPPGRLPFDAMVWFSLERE
jgi:hypothetical protein